MLLITGTLLCGLAVVAVAAHLECAPSPNVHIYATQGRNGS
jgi:hypothetical protein